MSYLGLFLWSFGVAIGPVMSPGPVSTAIVTQSTRHGPRVGPLVASGHALTELVMVGALALGMGGVLRLPVLAAIIGILGGAFLLWMGGTLGWAAVRRNMRLPQDFGELSRAAGDNPGSRKGRSLVGLGVVTTVSNPFWYLWWVGVASGYVLLTREQGPASLAAFYLGHISADYAWDTILAAVVGSGRRWLTDSVYQVLILVCSLFLMYTGVRFIWAGVGFVGG